jgi:hypothetical protein
MHSESSLRAYLGPHADYFIDSFKKFNNNGVEEFHLTWSWPAFFFGVFYVVYRKMYLFALIGLILCLIPGLIFLWNCLLAPLATKYLYYRQVNAKIDKYSAAIQNDEQLLGALRSAGGVNKGLATALAVIVSIIAIVGVFILVALVSTKG